MSGETLKALAESGGGPERKPGFYWVRLADGFEDEKNLWVVAEMREGLWSFAGWPHKWAEEPLVRVGKLLEVGERIDPPAACEDAR